MFQLLRMLIADSVITVPSDVGLRPLQSSLAPGIDQSNDQDGNKDEGFDEGQDSQTMKSYGPGIQENRLHIKNNEDEGKHVVANIELNPCLS